jgi:hypothetical protein
MEKIYPIDIAGIKKIGVEEWLKNYYVPITGKEFQTIYDNVFTSYFDTVKQHNDDVVYWIAISNIPIIFFTSQWISEVFRLIRLKERGYEYIIGKEKIRIPNDISTYKYNSLAKISIIGKSVSGLNFQERIKNVTRTIKYNCLPPLFANKYFLTNISNPVFLVGNRLQQEVVTYCNQNKISPICLPSMLFANNRNEKVDKDSELNEVVGFVYSFFVLLEKQFPEINSSLFELLRKELVERFIYSLLFFRQNVNVFRKFKLKKLLATGLGNPVHRLFCASWRYAGGEVVGFSHGNSYFYGCYSPEINKFLSLVSQYVTVTAGHKEIMQKAMEEFSCGLKMGNITVLKEPYYKQLHTELQRKKPINKIKKIMLVGCPMIGNYYQFFPSAYAFAQLELEIKLIKLLRSSGFYVIYKPHPVSMDEVEGALSEYADEVLTSRFEEVYDKADCIMFGIYASTTFGFSLLTNKPIVLVDVKENYWYPRAFELINKRCSVVKAEVADGRIVFNEQDVLDAVQESINNINYDILYEFAF